MVQANAAVQRASKTGLLEPVQLSITGVAMQVPAPRLLATLGAHRVLSSCLFFLQLRARGPTAGSLCAFDINF